MDKLAKRGVIQYLFKKGLTGKEIFDDMVNVLGSDAPSYATVKNWVAEFKKGRTSIFDDEHTGRRKSATTEENVSKVQDMVMEDNRLTVHELAQAVGISDGSVHEILTNVLGMRKLLTRWVPNLLTSEEKLIRIKLSQQHLDLFQRDKTDFMHRFITMDEMWVHHYDPEMRQQSAEWTEPGCSAPKQQKCLKTSKKIMASVFWDAKGILLIDYLQTGKTKSAEYYCNVLDQLNEKILEKRPGLRKIIFHQDNTPAHKSTLAMSKFKELHFELIEQPPYSPDLAPSNFWLFPNLKKFLRWKGFASNDDVITAVDGYFEGLPESHFRDGINELENRWQKCIEYRGDYIEE